MQERLPTVPVAFGKASEAMPEGHPAAWKPGLHTHLALPAVPSFAGARGRRSAAESKGESVEEGW